jgi:hypothetical protein
MALKNLFRKPEVVAPRPRGIAVFFETGKLRDMRHGDVILCPGSNVRAVTDHSEFLFQEIDANNWCMGQGGAFLPYRTRAKISGARSDDGLAILRSIAFHEGCGTRIALPYNSFTTDHVRRLFINDEQIF